jgi:hypothetical protein
VYVTVATKYSEVNTAVTVLHFSDVYNTFLHSTHQYTSQGLYPFGWNRSRLGCFCEYDCTYHKNFEEVKKENLPSSCVYVIVGRFLSPV